MEIILAISLFFNFTFIALILQLYSQIPDNRGPYRIEEPPTSGYIPSPIGPHLKDE
jgi:hypothetical protein